MNEPLSSSQTSRDSTMPSLRPASFFSVGALFLLFLGLDGLTRLVPFGEESGAPWNPALGICVAAVLLWRERALLLAFFAPILSALIMARSANALSVGVIDGLITGLETFLIYSGGRWLAAASSQRFLRNPLFATLFASLPTALIIGFLHALLLTFSGEMTAGQMLPDTIEKWIGAVSSVVIITPLFVTDLLPVTRRTLSPGRLIEAGVQALIVAGAVWTAFGLYPETASRYLFIVLLPLIWIALRFGIHGAVVMNGFVQACMVVSLVLTNHTDVDVTLFQALLLILSAAGLVLGLAVDENRAATLQLRAREEELATNLRVAATGELAGTLAHELGHPLGAISNYASALNHVLRKVAPDNADAMAISAKLTQEIVRATDTLHRMRDFFRTGTLAVERTDVGALLKDATLLLKDRFGHNAITPTLVIQGGANTVMGDRIQLRAVIYNLLVNAIDALKALPPNSRRIAATVRRDGQSIILEIEDSGPGVAADVRGDIFEPLVTTKKDGLGLGLSMSRSVVLAHGGQIELTTSHIGGAKFVVVLPAEGS